MQGRPGSETDPTLRAPSAQPSWTNNASPPPTEPDLPPIRSAQPSTTLRALVPQPQVTGRHLPSWVHRAVRRDVAIANRSEHGPSPVPGNDAINLVIIPGDLTRAIPMPSSHQRRPRSRATHLALFAISTCLVLAFLYAAVPLPAGATARISAFVVGTNGYVIPTPTPSPTATPQPSAPVAGPYPTDPGTRAILADIQAVFGPYTAGALAIARCESGYNPYAYNPTPVLGSHAMGVFQVLYPITWRGTSQAANSPYDAHANILAAHEIFTRDGNSWREWACTTG